MSGRAPIWATYALLATAVLLWSANAVIGRAAPEEGVPPLALNFWRWGLAFAIFAAFKHRAVWRQRALFLRHWRFCVGYALASVTLFNMFFYVGLQYTPAVQGALIQSLLPIAVLALAAIFLSHRISWREAVGIVFSVGGAAVIVLRGDLQVLLTLALNIGDLWVLASTISWAVQVLLTRWIPKEVDLFAFMAVAVGTGWVMCAPFYAVETAMGRPMPLTALSLFYVAYTGIAASVVAYAVWMMGLTRVRPAVAGYFANLYPVGAAALGILLLNETFAWYHGAGAILILAGIWLATARRAGGEPKTA